MKLVVLDYHVVITLVITAEYQMFQFQRANAVRTFLNNFLVMQANKKAETECIYSYPIVHDEFKNVDYSIRSIIPDINKLHPRYINVSDSIMSTRHYIYLIGYLTCKFTHSLFLPGDRK